MTDLSQSWTAADIAAKQRALVDTQLTAMREGKPPKHFEVMHDALGFVASADGATLLDAGCASAYYYEIIEYYHPGLFDYTGLDFSDALLTLAKRRYPEIKLIKKDLRALGYDKTFDVVLSSAALMHIRDWREALAELAKAARRWLILHRTWVTGETIIEIGDAYGHPAWYIRFGENELLGLLAAAYFGLVREWRDVEAGDRCCVNTYLFERIK